MADDKKKAAVKDIQEPEVVAAVQEEIKKLGENTKSNYDELRAKYEEFKSLLDSTKGEVDGLVKEQIAKLTTDITTRQQALDDDKAKQEKDFNTRMDTLEVAVRRLPKGGADGEEDPKVVQRETKEFFQTVMSKDEAGATMERMALAEEKGEISSEVYKAYRKVFNKYLRQQGDERNLDPSLTRIFQWGLIPMVATLLCRRCPIGSSPGYMRLIQ